MKATQLFTIVALLVSAVGGSQSLTSKADTGLTENESIMLPPLHEERYSIDGTTVIAESDEEKRLRIASLNEELFEAAKNGNIEWLNRVIEGGGQM